MSVTRELRGGICRLTLDRPDRGNAYDEVMIDALIAALGAAGADPAVKVIAIGGADRHFSTGPEPAYVTRLGGTDATTLQRELQRQTKLLRMIDQSPKPTIVRLTGQAVSLAVGMAAAADLVVASEDADIQVADVRLGLSPALIAPYLVRAVGRRHARRWMMTADRIRAPEARMAGLVDAIAPAGQVDGLVDLGVVSFLKCAPKAVLEMRSLAEAASRPIDTQLLEAMARSAEATNLAEEAIEGIAAHVESRRPIWTR